MSCDGLKKERADCWRRKAQDAVEDALMTSRKVPPLLQILSSALWLRQPDPSCFGRASGSIHNSLQDNHSRNIWWLKKYTKDVGGY